MTTDREDDSAFSGQQPAETLRLPLGKTGVALLASEVLDLVARRAVDLRRVRDLQTITDTALAITTGTEAEAIAALEALDDATRPLDWFLAERLGPVAKLIGTLWTEDKVSFLQATVGATRIYGHIRYRRRAMVPQQRLIRRAATFILVPGDMHTLGISAATDVFRSRGWDITLLVGQSHEDLCRVLERSDDLLFGLSAGSGHSMEGLARLVVAVTVDRPGAHVLVSGQIATRRDRVMALPGIDACEPDLDAAYQWLDAQTV